MDNDKKMHDLKRFNEVIEDKSVAALIFNAFKPISLAI
jgi:hypothetical protein